MTKIKGNNDGPGGRNDSYDIGARKDVPRAVVIEGRPGVFVVPNEGELNLFNRIMSSGKNVP